MLERGGDSGATLNAADEIATAAFLAGDLPFSSISKLVADVLQRTPAGAIRNLEDVIQADRAARRDAERRIGANA